MDRYDDFLSKNLPNYLENELISEITITDENGNDIEKIKSSFPNHDKLILIQFFIIIFLNVYITTFLWWLNDLC
jgi:ABC-type antimicrobial peptide transport system permease subunit